MRIPRDEGVLGLLVEPVIDGRAAVSYGRQVPRPGADLLEAFPRWFNYPETSEIRGLDTAGQGGARLVFCSNVFAAWKSEGLDAVGGFPARSLVSRGRGGRCSAVTEGISPLRTSPRRLSSIPMPTVRDESLLAFLTQATRVGSSAQT